MPYAQPYKQFVGQRIAQARKAAGITQADLSDRLGFRSRQILSNIEKGLRKIKPAELIAVIELLGHDLDYYTDPYRAQVDTPQNWHWLISTQKGK